MAVHPPQPMYVDNLGVVRFQPNKIIKWLFENEKLDLDLIATIKFSKEDRQQIAQQLGYSVSKFGDLSYVPRKLAETYDAKAANVLKQSKRKRM